MGSMPYAPWIFKARKKARASGDKWYTFIEANNMSKYGNKTKNHETLLMPRWHNQLIK